MVNDGDYVALFHSIHRVMQAEKILKEQKIPMLLIPAPRALKTECGLAIRYRQEDRAAIDSALKFAGLEPVELYVKQGEHFVPCGAGGVENVTV